MTPFRASSWETKPIRRMLISRSSRLKPSPFERWVRTTSPSSTSTLAPASRSRVSMRPEIVLLPAPDRPVNQRTKPLCTEDFLEKHVYGALGASVGCEVNAALLVCVQLPPPAPRALVLSGLDRARAGIAADAGVASRIKRMPGYIVEARVLFYLRRGPIGERTDLHGLSTEVDFGGAGAGFVLRAPQSDGPGLQLAELALERPHLADLAAKHSMRRVRAEQVGAVESDHALHFGRVGRDRLHADAITAAHRLYHFVSLGGK